MKTKPVIIKGRDVKNCPKTDCIHHPVNGGNGECGCIAGEWGMYEKAEYIRYTIQPTDSVAGVAERFGVDLHELVKLNPQVCTSGPQEGIEIKIPVDDGPAKQLFYGLLELYGSDAPSAFAMIYQIAEASHNPEIGLEATIEAAAELLEARDITGAFDLLGITKNPSLMYLECVDVDAGVTYPPSSEHKRFAELKEIRTAYKAVVEWGIPKSNPITEIQQFAREAERQGTRLSE